MVVDVVFVSNCINDMMNFNIIIVVYFNVVQLYIVNIMMFMMWMIFMVIMWVMVVMIVWIMVIMVMEFMFWMYWCIWWYDQSMFILCYFQQCCSQSFEIQFFIFSSWLNFVQQCVVLIQIVVFQLLLYFSGEFFQMVFVQQFCVWQFYFWNSQFYSMFNVVQQMMFVVFNEQQCVVSMICMIGMIDMVNVRFRIYWDIVVNYQVDMFNVQVMGCNVGCNQDVQMIIFQVFQCLFMQCLVYVIVQCGVVVVVMFKSFSYFQSCVFGMNEDNCCIKIFCFQEMYQCFVFVYILDSLVVLVDVRMGSYVGLNVYFLWFFYKVVGNVMNCFWYGCREQSGLMIFWDLCYNGFNVFDEVYVQYFVSFIQNQIVQFREVQSVMFQVVQQMVWSIDNDLWFLMQGV